MSIRIEGGLPDLPGTQIIGPSINNQDPHLLLDSDHGFMDPPKQPPVLDGVATSSVDPVSTTETTSANATPRSGPTVAAGAPLGGPVFGAANPPHATSGHASGPPFGAQTANGQTAPAQAPASPANGPTGPAATVGADPAAPTSGPATGPPPNGQPANGSVAAAHAGPAPSEPVVTSELPRPAPTPDSPLRVAYLAERTLRFPSTPGLWVWRGGLYVDRT
jgi:hypothetical protein